MNVTDFSLKNLSLEFDKGANSMLYKSSVDNVICGVGFKPSGNTASGLTIYNSAHATDYSNVSLSINPNMPDTLLLTSKANSDKATPITTLYSNMDFVANDFICRNMSGNDISLNTINMQTVTTSTVPNTLQWKTGNRSLSINMEANLTGAVLEQRIGEMIYANCTASLPYDLTNKIPALSCVSISQAYDSQITLVEPYDPPDTFWPMFGITAEPIWNQVRGIVVRQGVITGVQTNGAQFGETWEAGDPLYNNVTLNGGQLTNNPIFGNTFRLVVVGIVLHAHATNGSIYVDIREHMALRELNGTEFGVLANNDVLTYNSSSSKWENKPSSTASYGVLTNGATDMSLTTYTCVRVTPTVGATYYSAIPPAGATRQIIILTSGTSSFVITFSSTHFKAQGSLTTGTTSARYYVLNFVSDGSRLLETSRTVAMA